MWQQFDWFRLCYNFYSSCFYYYIAGIIYDVIVEPPSIGSTTDERGNSKPVSTWRSVMFWMGYRIICLFDFLWIELLINAFLLKHVHNYVHTIFFFLFSIIVKWGTKNISCCRSKRRSHLILGWNTHLYYMSSVDHWFYFQRYILIFLPF